MPIAIFTADCLSLFIFDPLTPSIGIVHAGWRSTKEQIARKALEAMHKEFHASLSQVHVGMGPALKSCCYEVGVSLMTSSTPACLKKTAVITWI